MKKIIILLICVVLLSGCSLTYEIDFNYNNIYEHINGEIDGNIYEIASSINGDGFYLEKELVENKIPSLKEYKDYYNKEIKVSGNKSYVDLNYRYTYDNYQNAYLLERCFEKSYVKNTDEYLYVSLGGNFKCFSEQDIKIKISSVYDIVKHNADTIQDDYYIWDIKMSEDENNVEFYISKEITPKKENTFSPLKIIIIIIFIIVGVIIFFTRKKNL